MLSAWESAREGRPFEDLSGWTRTNVGSDRAEQVKARRIVDAPLDARAENSALDATFANRDPAHVARPPHREGDTNLEVPTPAWAFDELRLGVRPRVLAVADERLVTATDARPSSYAFILISVKPEDPGPADAFGLEHTVGWIGIGGQNPEVLRKVSEVLALPPFAGLVDHRSIMPLGATQVWRSSTQIPPGLGHLLPGRSGSRPRPRPERAAARA